VVRPLELSDRPLVARPEPAARGHRRWGLLLVAGWLVQAGLRAWLSRAQMVPLAAPDESAYLIAARVLAGGVPANFSYSTLYPAGYPLLIMPVYWFTHDPVTVYRAVLLGINAPLSALVMPLGYVACRRLGLERPWAFGVAMVAALLPVALFYSQYAMTDAIYPVLVLAWLLATHSWLTARSVRGQYLAAVGSALLAGYSYAVHSRGAVMVAGYVLVGALVAWRRLVPWRTALAAAVALCLPLGAGDLLNGHLSSVMYPSGPRTLAGEALIRLQSVHGVIFVLEMAAGQLWRFVLDGWGVSGLGLAAAVFVIVQRGLAGREARIMAALAVGVTLVTAVTSPAALPPTQPQAWASGRYLDGMVVVFFLVGAAVLLRAAPRRLLAYAACVVPPTLLAAIVVFAYAGGSVPTSGFGAAFVFAEPAVLTQDWTSANVLLATVVALGLLAAAVGTVLFAARIGGSWAPRLRTVVLAGLGAVSLVASVQMTSHISQANTPGQERNTTAMVTGTGLKPGEHLVVGDGVSWEIWMPQAYEVWWAQVRFFNIHTQLPPADATVVEVAWPAGMPAAASWPHAPAGWKIVLTNRTGRWVAWRR
jgi:hypothetical protein